jgi:Protein of unknown function (DUF2442)
MRTISQVVANRDWTLDVTFADGSRRIYDVQPLLATEAFEDLKDIGLFLQVRNGGYFVEWPTGADLSADTLCREGVAA